jgi:hypothetical protein
MPPYDVSDSLVQVAASASGPWATIEDVQTWDATHGSDAPTRTRVFGRTQPYVRAGDETDTYSLTGLLNLEDVGGQNVLRESRDSRDSIFIRILPAGDDPGARGYTQEIQVTEYTDAGDADGEFVSCSFSADGVGPKVDINVSV